MPRIFFKSVSLCFSANSDIVPGVCSHTRLQKTRSLLKMAVKTVITVLVHQTLDIILKTEQKSPIYIFVNKKSTFYLRSF